MEHFMCLSFFQEPQAFMSLEALWERYMHLCVSHTMLKFHFAGLTALTGAPLSQEDYIQVVVLLTRSGFTQGPQATQTMLQWLQSNRLDTFARLALLVRS